ncbi:MAG: hypothetical protein GX786_06570 [Clostridiales bacterium]|nr:hypothetical protein [Clostridiales bacterium]
MAETTMTKVIVRATGVSNGKQVARIEKAKTIITLTGQTNLANGYTWYSVKLASGTTGWIRGDLLRIYTESEKQAYLDSLNPGGGSGSGGEATYETLRIGSSGDAVSRLQTSLKEKGYYTGSISGYYDSATATAVRAFQRAAGLSQDGIAGSNTLHALYGTVPPGGGSSADFTLYPVEKVDWYSGGINSLWARGSLATVKTVEGGYTFTLKRLFGGSHADAEPLTTNDTAQILKIYNVSSANQLTENKHYQRVPVWITVGNRTFAASMYGVPHGEKTIVNNNFPGQLCIHFINSKTHGSSVVDPGHQKAIQKAYDAYWKTK